MSHVCVPGHADLQFIGCLFKLAAAGFFNLNPMTAIVLHKYPTPEDGSVWAHWAGEGCPWSNFVGICLFHTGNTFSVVGMRSGFR